MRHPVIFKLPWITAAAAAVFRNIENATIHPILSRKIF
jgi:hypothetical protein